MAVLIRFKSFKQVLVTAPTVLLPHRYGICHRLWSDARHQQ